MSQKSITPPPMVPNGTGSPLLDQQILLNQQMATLIANTTANFTDLYNGAGGGGGGGNVLRNGSGAPLNSLGIDGDFYIDTTAHNLYGPRAGGVWPSAVSIVGPQGSAGSAGSNGTNGNTINHGTGAPGSGVGNNGDFYIDTAGNMLYGAKSAGAWGSGTSLVGPAGSGGSGSAATSSTLGTVYVSNGGLISTSLPTGQTLRNIATRCRPNFQTFTGATAQGLAGYSWHVNMGPDIDPSVGISIVVGNWFANSAGETAGAAASVEYIGIEYPIGNTIFKVATWNTQTGLSTNPTSCPCPAGNDVQTDPILGLRIKQGEAFKVHRMQTFASAINPPVSDTTATNSYDGAAYYWSAAQIAAIDPVSFVSGAAFSGGQTAAGAFTIYPLAIIGMSNIPSVLIIGDSRTFGKNDATGVAGTATNPADYGYLGTGQAARSIGHKLPYINLGVENDTVQQFNSTHTFRARQQAYHTHVDFHYGINDLVAGRTGSVVFAAAQSCWALFPTKTISASTVYPKTTSTDSWATVANQTLDASNAQRVIYNNLIRGKPSPLQNYWELAYVVEDQHDNGKWKGTDSITNPVPFAITGDGLHCGGYGYQMIQQSGALNPNLMI